MAIFPLIEAEPIVQVGDKTRINAVKSFVSKDEPAITKVEIEPESGSGFIDVTGIAPISAKNWFLDWAYATDGVKTITLQITTALLPTPVVATFTKTITILTEADDKLWSDDSDLISIEPDILDWIRPGRATYKDYHRAAQKRILEWFDNIKVWNKDGEVFTKDDITLAIAYEDLKRISTYWSAELIYGGITNKPDDVFSKAEGDMRKQRKELQSDRSRIRADYNKDGAQSKGEEYHIRSIRLTR